LTAPNLNDPTSIQNQSTNTVFLIVKNQEGKWVFPERTILEKENFDEWKKSFLMEVTGNS
jgi:hypothetical protein